jgi:hypothetical protein
MPVYFFLPGFWVSAEAEATLASLVDVGFCKVLAAAVAAADDVTLAGFTCDNVEPAADFAGFGAVGLRSTFEAAEAARGPVFSLLVAISTHSQYVVVFVLQNIAFENALEKFSALPMHKRPTRFRYSHQSWGFQTPGMRLRVGM